MSDKFQNKYRIPSARLPHWDYSWSAAYFVTICTKDRECWLGDIVNGKMNLSAIGEIAQTEWLITPGIRPDMNLELGAFVIMPNHFHSIIIIGENEFNAQGNNGDGCCGRDAMHGVSTTNQNPTKTANAFGTQSKNLASIIRGFKSSVTMKVRSLHPSFAWQSRFHDHIIRDETSFQKITNYILANPGIWVVDKLYK